MPKNLKHYICAFEPDCKGAAQAWAETWEERSTTGKQQTKGYTLEYIQPNRIKTMETNAVLYVHAHGMSPYREDNEPYVESIYTTKATLEGHKNAEQFADWLVEKGLKTEHKILKIAACYSDEFARLLSVELQKKGYDDITVYGYKGELMMLRGRSRGMLAGIAHHDPAIFTNHGNGVWTPDDVKIAGGAIVEKRASNYRVACKNGVMIGDLKLQTEEKIAEDKKELERIEEARKEGVRRHSVRNQAYSREDMKKRPHPEDDPSLKAESSDRASKRGGPQPSSED